MYFLVNCKPRLKLLKNETQTLIMFHQVYSDALEETFHRYFI